MHSFDPLTIPLRGQQLVEASAGTGKTYSIAQLYLRFILEGGLDVDEILVVTFTTSATEELRQRIRLRLREALDTLLVAGEGEVATNDRILRDLLQVPQNRLQAIQRLTSAIARMDESAVFTIHSFCHRILQDNAFETGSEFETEFIESEHQLRLEIIEDFWRMKFYPAPAAEAAWASATWNDPDGLLQVLLPIMAHAETTCIPEVTNEEVNELRKLMNSMFQEAMEAWREGFEEIIEILEHHTALTRNAKSFHPDRVEKILANMEKLASLESAPWLLPEGTELLAASVMGGHVKKNKTAPEHSFFRLFEDFYQCNMELVLRARNHILLSSYRFLTHELRRRKQERALMYFDDLLTGLDKALAGPGGKGLIQQIREQYSVALVDEFQDTDPVQYRIFHTLFGMGNNPGLFMIGDPKQSIYSFRGADVFAYIQAKKDTLKRSAAFTMDTNYRSVQAMVQAVNGLFDRKNSFIFGEDISFSAVRCGSSADKDPLVVQGVIPHPLRAMFLQVATFAAEKKDSISKDRAEKAASSWTAQEIARLLYLGKKGEATIGSRPLSGGDLAVLVRTHREAEMIQQELSQFRITSVYYSQESVFATEEARELYHVLAALLDLADHSRVNAALATPLFGKDAHDIEQLVDDASAWEAMIAQLQEEHILWRTQGIAAMLQHVFTEHRVVQRLIDIQGGERKLTNYLHLAELLQAAAEDQHGMDGLVHWLEKQRFKASDASATQQLRLESDENLVRIVTIHKAKGLEYPVVFLPFPWSCRSVVPEDVFSFHLPPNFNRVVDIGSGNDRNVQLAERERLAEDLRLLYVAVTRARYCCYFSWGRVNKMGGSALAWLLHRESPECVPVLPDLSEERIVMDLETLNENERLLEFIPLPDGVRGQIPSARDTQKVLAPRVFRGRIDTGWTISSYSKMVRASVHLNRAEEVEHEPSYPSLEIAGQGVFSFPRGAAAGTCLHNIFEQLDFADCTDEALEPLVREQLRLNGLDVLWSKLVCSWVKDILKTPLSTETNIRLQDLERKDRLAEMGFYFSVDCFDPLAFNEILIDFGFSPIELHEEMAGLMRGYIDIVFRYGGKYYLADYKSNYLGASVADYYPSRLVEPMGDHRYDLQYLLYTVALHRYLGMRIKNYEYERHIGGVLYLFLRGMHPDHPCGTGIYNTVPDRELIERLDTCFGGPRVN